jgi:hypothetical protein
MSPLIEQGQEHLVPVSHVKTAPKVLAGAGSVAREVKSGRGNGAPGCRGGEPVRSGSCAQGGGKRLQTGDPARDRPSARVAV